MPLAAGLAAATFAAAQVAPADAAETGYLAVLLTAVLLPAAALAVPPAYELGTGALLAVTAVWAVPAGAARGAAVTLLLVATLAVAAYRNLERSGGELSWSNAIPLALGVQLLVRADRLLAPPLDAQTLVGLLALPVAAAGALVVLGGRRDARNTLVAAAAGLVLVPGFSVTVTLGLLALATVEAWRRGLLPRWRGWAVAAALLAVSLAWDPALGLWLLACALAYAGAGSWKWQTAAVAVALAVAVLTPLAVPWLEAPERTWQVSLRQLSLLFLLLPAVARPRRERWLHLLVVVLLALVGLRIGPDLGALAAPLAMAALVLPAEGGGGEIQALWSGLLLAAGTLTATYPWLHGPLVDPLGLIGLQPGWPAAITLVVAVLVLGVGWDLARRRLPRLGTARGPALLLVGLAAFAALPPVAERPLGEEPVVLGDGAAGLAFELSGAAVSELVVDSYLSDSAALAVGTPVADVHLTAADGRRATWAIKAGVDTGEWAARRPDVAGLPGFKAPPPWLAWVAPGGRVIAQRYRGRWRLDSPMPAVKVEVVRRQELPPKVSLALFHLELRP